MKRLNADVWLGLLVMLAAILGAFFWVPLDSGSPAIENLRGRVSIGDAMAPTVTLVLVALGGVITIIEGMKREAAVCLVRHNLGFLVAVLVIVGAGLALMRWSGPLAIGLWELGAGEMPDYRALRDTMPWKFIGFLMGGTFMVTAPIGLVQRRLSLGAILIGLLAALAMILVYDLPFDDLILPPNGNL